MVDISHIVGFSAGTLVTISFIPQVIKAWKTKRTGDLSLSMYVLFCTGIFLWLIWSIIVDQLPSLVTNAVLLPLALTVLYLKIKHG